MINNIYNGSMWEALPNYVDTDVYHYYNKAYNEQKIQSFETITKYSLIPYEIKVIPDAIAKRNNATIDFTTSENGTNFNIRFNK
ncbi:hypothetical protein [Bacillus sp. AFS088145]|uniref:hypothetical protein n=1 Tax=Bacillus sp. AFS088145 TaxID=2033514 RepID=UPI00115565A8|nr:hypothetical protein [Bacillus sp. AFS088145]